MDNINKKKVAVISGLVASVCILGTTTFANGGIKLVVDGQPTVPTVAPQNVDGHVMVPIRFVSDSMGANVQWDQETETVSIDTGDKKSLQMEVEQFVRGLAPHSADQAVELYMNGLQHRNGALQYAALSEELRKKALPDFEKSNWVTGVSSPWLANWSIVKQEKVGEETSNYQIKAQMATSTGPAEPAIMRLTVTKTQDHWFVTSLGDDQPDRAISEKEVAQLLGDAQKHHTYIRSGGNLMGEIKEFSVKNRTVPYRWMGSDLDTKDKFMAYLEEVFTPEQAEAYWNTCISNGSIVEIDGKLAQPNADGGSMLSWSQSKVTFTEGDQATKKVHVEVPVGEFDKQTFDISLRYVEGIGWRVDQSVETVR